MKNCGTCHYYDDSMFCNEPDDAPDDQLGSCTFPSDELPLSMRFANRERTSVKPNMIDCPTWKEKT